MLLDLVQGTEDNFSSYITRTAQIICQKDQVHMLRLFFEIFLLF